MTTMTPPTGRDTTLAAPLNKNWRAQALCREVDPELFFPVGDGAAAKMQTQKAKAICARCPARGDCLEWALDTGQQSGVWGGLSEAERRRIARSPFSHTQVCMENQDLIEKRLAAGWSMRDIGSELGVGHWAVQRAATVFRSRRAAVGSESA
jgi:hypothetical protein